VARSARRWRPPWSDHERRQSIGTAREAIARLQLAHCSTPDVVALAVELAPAASP
jgi:hypothetical protein